MGCANWPVFIPSFPSCSGNPALLMAINIRDQMKADDELLNLDSAISRVSENALAKPEFLEQVKKWAEMVDEAGIRYTANATTEGITVWAAGKFFGSHVYFNGRISVTALGEEWLFWNPENALLKMMELLSNPPSKEKLDAYLKR